MTQNRHAILYRMVLPTHECPFGVQAKELLEEAGYTVEEHILGTREEVEAYKEQEGVDTTPQTFIEGQRIGGSADLETFLTREAAG